MPRSDSVPKWDSGRETDTGDAADPWDKMVKEWRSLGRKLRDTYRESAVEAGPTEDEVKAALRTLGGAFDRMTNAFGAAVRDEQVRQNVKKAATGFVEAVGAAFSELGSELRRSGPHDQPVEEPGTGDSAGNNRD